MLQRTGAVHDERRRELARMRAVATGLLVAMLALFLFATAFQAGHSWLAYVRAFAEAAMVGALADWFAVTALFRRPLGLPIPHTAVIPHNKERIGDSLGRFIEEHFLPPEVIRTRLAEVDIAGRLAGWLSVPANAAELAGQTASLLPHLLAGLDPARMRELVRDKLSGQLEKIDLALFAGEIIAALTAANRHQLLLDEVLRQSAAYIAEKEPEIRRKIRDSTGWLWQKLSVDERAFNAIMSAVESVLSEVEADADHELRRRFDRLIRAFGEQLTTAANYREEAEAIKLEIIRNPAVQAYLAGLWDELQGCVATDAAVADSEIRRHLEAALRQAGLALQGDAALRAQLDGWLREAIARLVETRRHEVARLIPDTVRTWDADTMAERLELQVGKDLQFIRINGTLVGGLVGLLIYAMTRLFG